MPDFGVTPQGFKAKRFSDLMEDSAISLKSSLNLEIDTKPNSVAKVLTSTYNLALSELWAAQQAQQAMFDIDKAEGVHLDNLVGYLRMTRLEAAPSYGNVYLDTDSIQTTVPQGTIFRDTTGAKFQSKLPTVVGLNYTVSAVFDVIPTALSGTVLSIVIVGLVFSQTISVSVPDSIDLLVADINVQTPTTNFVATNTTVGTDYQVTLHRIQDAISSVVNIPSGFNIKTITSIVAVEKTILSAASVPAGSVTGVPSLPTAVSCTNRADFIIGTSRETDSELRLRHKSTITVVGKGTVDAITSALYQLAGVTYVKVLENDTMVEDAEGIPPKAIHCVVKGGIDTTIAQSIWDTKSCSIQTFGSKTVIAADSQNNIKFINFSRPFLIFLHASINYTLYAEEAHLFPSSGEADMLRLVQEYGEQLTIGEDIIPQRFETHVMKNIGGLETITILFGTTAAALDATPTLTHDIIPVAGASEAAFVTSRLTVSRG